MTNSKNAKSGGIQELGFLKILLQFCNDRLVIRIQTILALDTFINVLVDELNKLKDKQVNDIHIDDIDGFIPESEDTINENYVELETQIN